MSESTVVFVDDGFFRLIKRYFQEKIGKKLRFLETFRNISKNENLEIKHLFIYMAPPFQSRTPTEDEKDRKKRYDDIKKMLDKKNWITVREGRCQRVFDSKNNPIYSQKGVDSWLVADLCLFKNDYPDINKIILISSDSDFAPIIELIKNKMKVEVILYTFFENKKQSFFYRSNHLLKACTKWVKLNEGFFMESGLEWGGAR